MYTISDYYHVLVFMSDLLCDVLCILFFIPALSQITKAKESLTCVFRGLYNRYFLLIDLLYYENKNRRHKLI